MRKRFVPLRNYLYKKKQRVVALLNSFLAGEILFFLFQRAQATGANVGVLHFAVDLDIDLLNVCGPAPSRFDITVADLVARHSSFSADAAYFRHVLLPVCFSRFAIIHNISPFVNDFE